MFIKASDISLLISSNTARAGGLRLGGPNHERSVHSLIFVGECVDSKHQWTKRDEAVYKWDGGSKEESEEQDRDPVSR